MFYIENNEDLLSLCEEIKKTTNILAIDTEFIKRIEYFPTLSIVQISFFNGDIIKNCIVDALAENMDLQPFFEIFNDEKIKKIFHSCSQDLEAIYKLSGKIPVNIEDTQIMAEFCGYRSNIGYFELVKEVLGVSMKKDKKIQSGDWSKRPLSNKQLEYAVVDVDYLTEIFVILGQKLDKNRNYKYYRAEIEDRYNSNMIENLVKGAWKKMRFNLGNKETAQINGLKKVCAIREKMAVSKNIIRSLVVPDIFIKALINDRPESIAEIDEIFKDNKEVSEKNRHIKAKLLNSYCEAVNKTQSKSMYIVDLKDKRMQQKFDEISDYIIAESRKREISPELIQNRMDLSSAIAGCEKLDKILSPWQMEIYGKRIEEIILRP